MALYTKCGRKVMAIVHTEFVPPRQTVNQAFYKDILERLIRVRADIADKWMLHHDNAPYHTALSFTVFLTSKGIPMVPQPLHLTSVPVTFSFFLNLKMSSKDIISVL